MHVNKSTIRLIKDDKRCYTVNATRTDKCQEILKKSVTELWKIHPFKLIS